MNAKYEIHFISYIIIIYYIYLYKLYIYIYFIFVNVCCSPAFIWEKKGCHFCFCSKEKKKEWCFRNTPATKPPSSNHTSQQQILCKQDPRPIKMVCFKSDVALAV